MENIEPNSWEKRPWTVNKKDLSKFNRIESLLIIVPFMNTSVVLITNVILPSSPSGKLPDRSGPASCRTGKCCNLKFSCNAMVRKHLFISRLKTELSIQCGTQVYWVLVSGDIWFWIAPNWFQSKYPPTIFHHSLTYCYFSFLLGWFCISTLIVQSHVELFFWGIPLQSWPNGL